VGQIACLSDGGANVASVALVQISRGLPDAHAAALDLDEPLGTTSAALNEHAPADSVSVAPSAFDPAKSDGLCARS
jgi:hypothetical protein